MTRTDKGHRLLGRFLGVVLAVATNLLLPASSPAQTGLPPDPVYHSYPTVGTYPGPAADPAGAVPLLKSMYNAIPQTVWLEPGGPAVLHCQANPLPFGVADFRPRVTASNLSEFTIQKPMPRTVAACTAYEGLPGWQHCVGAGCVQGPDAAYSMVAECPVGWHFRAGVDRNRCDCPAGEELARGVDGRWTCRRRCIPGIDRPSCWQADASCTAGNPMLPGVGAKVQTEVDYEGAGADALAFRRTFRSNAALDYVEPGAWSHWVHNWGRRVETYPEPGWTSSRAYVVRDDASLRIYTTNGSTTWTAWQVGDRNRLTETRDTSGKRTGFRYQLWADDSVEHYDAQGRLLMVVQRNGWTTTLGYSTSTTPATVAPRPGLLISVRNHFGRELRLTYDAAGRLRELLPPGAVSGAAAGSAISPIRYAHDEAQSLGAGVGATGQLTSVIWQDGNLRRYHYEHVPQPGLLTGITDETGTRVGTYLYTNDGRVFRSEGAQGQNIVDVQLLGPTSAQVIDRSGPSPVVSTLQWEQVQGMVRPTSVSAPCPLCGNTAASVAYTATGEVARRVAHDGRVTFFSYDAKGRETQRATYAASFAGAVTRPALSLAEAVTTTQWHAIWMLPLQRSEPGAIATWTYDTKGNVSTERRQATTDATGASGLAAARTGTMTGINRAWTTSGLLASATDVTDGVVARSWLYGYGPLGDLLRVTGSEAGVSVGAGVSTDTQGRLTGVRTDSGQQTLFAYDARGLMAQAQLPDHAIGFALNARGFVQRLDFSTGQRLTIEYDATGLPQRVVDGNGISMPIAALRLAPTPSGPSSTQLRQAPTARRSSWLAHLPLPAARAQVAATTSLPARGLGLMPLAQSRPLDPSESGPAGPTCCGADQRLQAEQLQQLLRRATSAAALTAGNAADAFDFWFDWLLTWRSRSDLRANLLCDARNQSLARSGCYEAHHIVAWAHWRAQEARDILSWHGVDLNSAENGALLSCDRHRGLHTYAYYDAVNDELRGSTTRADVVGRLARIRFKIASGTFPSPGR